MIAALFLVLLQLDVAEGFSKVYSQWKCAELHTLPQYVTASYYFVLRESCELYISTRPITEQLYHEVGRQELTKHLLLKCAYPEFLTDLNHGLSVGKLAHMLTCADKRPWWTLGWNSSNCSSGKSGRKKITKNYKYILFAWENDRMAILQQNRISKDAHVVIVNATKQLSNKSYGIVSIAKFQNEFKHIVVHRKAIGVQKIMYETCHREHHDKVVAILNVKRIVWFRCYSLSGTELIEQIIQYTAISGIILIQRKFNLPERYSYGRSIASYITEIGEHRLWVLNGKTLYDFDLSKVERGAYNSSNPLIYQIPDRHAFKTRKAEITFADAGSVITRRCYSYNRYRINGCLYRYNIPRGNKLISRCIYDEMFDIRPAWLSITFESETAGATAIFYGLFLYFIEIIYRIQSGTKRLKGDSVEWKGYNMAYAPVQILGILTVMYLCFFFYYAFKPNPHSDLTELSKVMDEQLYELSILTKEVVETMKRKKKQVMLKRRKTDITQPSLEVCSPGTTHRSSYENELRSDREEAVKRKASKEVHRNKDILKSHTLTKARSKEPMRASAEGVLDGAHAQKRLYQQDYHNVGHQAAEKRMNIESKT